MLLTQSSTCIVTGELPTTPTASVSAYKRRTVFESRKYTARNRQRFTAPISKNEVRIQFFPHAEFRYSSVSSGCQSSNPRMSKPAAKSRLI